MSRRLYSNILAFGISLVSLVESAEANPGIYPASQQRQEAPQPSRLPETEIMQILGLSNHKEIVYLPQGYVTSRGIQAGLLTIAGVYGGENVVIKTREGKKIMYSVQKRKNVLLTSPNFMKAVQNADVNGDRFVTSPEINDLKLRVYKKYAR